jgi:hypothetical protein
LLLSRQVTRDDVSTWHESSPLQRLSARQICTFPRHSSRGRLDRSILQFQRKATGTGLVAVWARIDYPGLDVVWGTKNNVIVREGDTMILRESPVPEMPNDLKQLVTEEK